MLPIYSTIKNSFSALDGNSSMLEFLLKRIQSDNYRGIKSAQHNRYDSKQVKFMLMYIKKYNGLTVPPGDSGKFPMGYQPYIDFAKAFSKEFDKRNSENTIKKNIFPDLDTMGFISRSKQVDRSIQVTITKLGTHFVNANTINSRLIYSGAINRLFNKWIDNIITILSNTNFKYLKKDEIQLFVSAIGDKFEYSTSLDEAISYIDQYRKFGRPKQNVIISTLKDNLKPEFFQGSKTQKRDFHNWQNKIDQFVHMLKDNLLLQYDESQEKIYLRGQITVDNQNYSLINKKRSQIEKSKYFDNNNIIKKDYLGFELHHIIEFSEAINIEQLALIDNWKNMIFIDGTSHNKITQSGKKYYYFDYDSEHINLSTPIDHMMLKYDENVAIDVKKLSEIKEYNMELVNSL